MRYTAIVLALLLAGCGGGDGPTGAQPQGLTETLGQAVTGQGEVAYHSPLEWARDGTEVFYFGESDEALKAVRISDGAIRVVNTSPTRQVDFSVSWDGAWIYRTRYNTTPQDKVGMVLERVPSAGGPAELLGENVTMHNMSAAAFPPLSRSGDLLAYSTLGEAVPQLGSRTDTLYLYDLQSGVRTRLGFGLPLVFSPDGSRLLYDERPCDDRGTFSNPCDTYVLDLETLTTQHISWDKGDIGKEAWWDRSGIRSLGVTGDFYDGVNMAQSWIVRNLSLGTVQIAYQLSIAAHEVPHSYLGHSPDGSKVAGWMYQSGIDIIKVVDLASGRASTVVVSPAKPGWSLAFSPDGDRIAYMIGTGVFVQGSKNQSRVVTSPNRSSTSLLYASTAVGYGPGAPLVLHLASRPGDAP